MINLKTDNHPKITHFIENALVNDRWSIQYFGFISLHITFKRNDDDKRLKTFWVYMNHKGINIEYCTKFIDKLSQEQTNFVLIHEILHPLFNHSKRTIEGGYNKYLSNIAQDMIINTIITDEFLNRGFVKPPHNEHGEDMALYIPKDYKDVHVFEILYKYLIDEKYKFDKKKKKRNDNKLFKGKRNI
jgi:predicted metal-dependent peptidase